MAAAPQTFRAKNSGTFHSDTGNATKPDGSTDERDYEKDDRVVQQIAHDPLLRTHGVRGTYGNACGSHLRISKGTEWVRPWI